MSLDVTDPPISPRRLVAIRPLPGGIEHRAEIGEAPEMLWVAVGDLRIDPDYQRGLGDRSVALIRRMVADWSWDLAQAITICEAEDGGWEVIDGQHRAVAAISHGGIAHLPAIALPRRDRAAAAKIFSAVNSARVQVTPGWKLKAAIAAGEPDAVAVSEAAAKAGARLLFSPPSQSLPLEGVVTAAGKLLGIARRRGRAGLARVLRICVEAKLAPIRAEHLGAVDAILHEPEWADGARADARIVAAMTDWDAIEDQADLDRIDAGIGRNRARAVALHRRIARVACPQGAGRSRQASGA